jgi:CRISPR-associated protein Csd2
MIDLTKPGFQHCLDPNRRHDFILLFEVTDGNPNGDPDAGNMPRVDPETMHGLVTDVCLKRKVRNYVALTKQNADGKPAEGYGIFVEEKGVLNRQIETAYKDLDIDLSADPSKVADGKARKTKGVGQGSEVESARQQLCRTKFDVRMFGAVMSTGANAGQVRGPLQMTFARSESPIVPLDVSITRMAVATEREAEAQGGDNRTIGRKALIPYGLYRGHGFFSAPFAKQTCVTAADLRVFWEALMGMWDHDHSAARGLMSCRGLYVFSHENGLGNAPAHQLFDRLELRLRDGVPTPRRFADYVVTLNRDLPEGVTLTPLVEG